MDKEKIKFMILGGLISLTVSLTMFLIPRIFPDSKKSDLKIVDVSFVGKNNDKIFSPLNIWLTNNGNKPALIKRLTIKVNDILEIEPYRSVSFPFEHIQQVSAVKESNIYTTHEIGIEDKGKKFSTILSQEISPGESDKFQIQIGNKFPLSGKYVINLSLELIYDETNNKLEFPEIIVGGNFISETKDINSTTINTYNLGLYVKNKISERINNNLKPFEKIDSIELIDRITKKNNKMVRFKSNSIVNNDFKDLVDLINKNNLILNEIKNK